MILIDVGNTNIVFAVSVNKKIKNIKRIDTNKEVKSFNNIVSKIIKIYLTLVQISLEQKINTRGFLHLSQKK